MVMASALPLVRLLLINNGVRSELGDVCPTCLSTNAHYRRARITSSAQYLSHSDREFRVKAQAVSEAAPAPPAQFRSIGQLNEAIRTSASVAAGLALLAQTKAAGLLTPNEATYASLMLLCRRRREGFRALTIHESMKNAGEPISLRTYNTLLSCCQQSQRLEDALRIKAEMEEKGITLDCISYTTLIDLVARVSPSENRRTPGQRLEKAVELLKEMEGRSITPDTRTFNSLISAASDFKMSQKALEFYQSLVKRGLSANDYTFELLLQCLGTGGRLKAAMQVYNETKAAGVALLASTYNFLIQACATAPVADSKQAWLFYEEMTTVKNIKANAKTYTYLIIACCKNADYDGAMKALALMKELTKTISMQVYNQLIECASNANSLDNALQMYEEMKGIGYKPDVKTYSSLVSVCIRSKKFDMAEEIKNELKDSGVSSNQVVVVLHSTMRAYGDVGKWEDAINVLREMEKKKELMPTALSYAIAIDSCVGKKEVRSIFSLGEKMLQLTPGMKAGLELYKEALDKELFKNFNSDDLFRCDLRGLNPGATVVALIAWLKEVRQNPPSVDLVVVTANSPDNSNGGLPKMFKIARQTIKSLGLQVEKLDTLATESLTVTKEDVQSWISKPGFLEDFVQDSTVQDESASVDTQDSAQDPVSSEGISKDSATIREAVDVVSAADEIK